MEASGERKRGRGLGCPEKRSQGFVCRAPAGGGDLNEGCEDADCCGIALETGELAPDLFERLVG